LLVVLLCFCGSSPKLMSEQLRGTPQKRKGSKGRGGGKRRAAGDDELEESDDPPPSDDDKDDVDA
jgi:hypothetical protein